MNNIAAESVSRRASGNDVKPVSNNPSQIRGDINKGLSKDKRLGFDPAAAPLEADAEAAGTSV